MTLLDSASKKVLNKTDLLVDIQGVLKVTPDFIQLKSQWIFFYDIFYIYASSSHF